MKQLSKKECIAFAESEGWKEWSYKERSQFQMVQDRLCMPFHIFHEAIEKTLGRPVYTHEFGLNREGLLAELFEGASPPTLQEIMEMIPEEKRIIIGL